MFDTHAHLNLSPLAEDAENYVNQAKRAGVSRILVPSCDVKTSRLAVDLAAQFNDVYAALGFHPTALTPSSAADFRSLEPLFSNPKVIALGEIGLDFFHVSDASARKQQYELFELQLAFALEHNLPVLIHAREAGEEALAILKSHHAPKAVFHCFPGPLALQDKILAADYFVSYTGIVTYPKATEVHACAAAVPADRFFLETDCPYLAPQSVRGKTNHPAHLPEIAAKLAELRHTTPEEIITQTTTNALSFFGLN